MRRLALALVAALTLGAQANAQGHAHHQTAAPAKTDGPPTVASTFPPEGATIPAGVDTIAVTYDRPMAQGWSFATGGEQRFPEVTGAPVMSGDRRTITLPVKLRAASTYVIWLNTERYTNFKDEAGRPATPYRLTFTTSN